MSHQVYGLQDLQFIDVLQLPRSSITFSSEGLFSDAQVQLVVLLLELNRRSYRLTKCCPVVNMKENETITSQEKTFKKCNVISGAPCHENDWTLDP